MKISLLHRDCRRLSFPLLGLAALFASGCGEIQKKFGKLGEETLVSIQVQPAELEQSSLLPGRVMVYLTGVEGTSFSTSLLLQNETDTASTATLPNGRYRVFALGWVGPNPAENQAKCGVANGGVPLALNGGSITIPLTLNAATCQFGSAVNTVFNDANFGDESGINFAQLNVNFCNGVSGPSCTATDNSWGGLYLKMSLDTYRRQGTSFQKTGEFPFGCGFINTSNATSGKRIPFGSSQPDQPKIFSASFAVYSNNTCSGAPLFTFSATNGLKNGATSGAAASTVNHSGSIVEINVDPL